MSRPQIIQRDYERTVLAGIQLGIMQACLDVVVPYVRERKQFGQAIGSFQLIQAKVAGEAVQALGGAGYTKDWPVERFMRGAKLLDIGAGTNEIRRMLIGREIIGAAA